MFHNNSPLSAGISGKPAPAEESPLPRGECTFIRPESESNGIHQRCSCRSFYPDSAVRSQCGCGHQAWHHEAQSVSADQYLQVVEQMRHLKDELQRFEKIEQELKQELAKERKAREQLAQTSRLIEARMYENMYSLKIAMDDKVEAVVDKTTDYSDEMKGMKERLAMLDEVSMTLEDRVDQLEQASGLSRDVTTAASTPKVRPTPPKVTPVPQLPLLMQSQHTLGQLPIRTDKKYPLSWSVRVIFVPRKSQKFAFDPDSMGYKRCASRKLQQNLEFASQDSSSFANRIDTAFKIMLRGRPWMPLTGHRPADEPFGRMALTLLPTDLIHRDIWDYPFLEDHCIAHDKMQGDVLYITLQYEDLTWNEIRFLPSVTNMDDSCWNHDDELDGTAKYKSLDSEIMDDFQDPPPTYSSRTHSLAARAPSKLDVLANSAALLGPIERAQSVASSHSVRLSPMHRTSTHSSNHSTNPRFSSERSSLRSFETDATDDEHRDKKPKLRSKHSMPTVNGGNSSHQPMYVSGRSKRKMPVKEKGVKEPLHFNVTSLPRWGSSILHPHSSKGKEVAHSP